MYRRIAFSLLIIILASCGTFRAIQYERKYGPSQPGVDRMVAAHNTGEVSFYTDVQPILERRCSVCHSCYDAPCQLKTTSFDGIERGGTKALVYNAARLTAEQPTRLDIDADSAPAWRELGFHPVLNERHQTPEINLDNSLLNLMLQLKKEHPLPQTDLVPDSFDLRLDRKYICTTAEDFGDFKDKYPLWGMPYALPGLADTDREVIVRWLRQGARITPKPPLSDKAAEVTHRWETFLNGPSLKEQLMSRYLYEHLFIGRIHFEGLPDREFYRLVRSSTPPGEPVAEINAVRPYDDPGVETVYYRFRRVDATIAVKDHTVYHMTTGKMNRYRELFLNDDVVVTGLPSYKLPETANPFMTFAELPALSRYKFMLDDATIAVKDHTVYHMTTGKMNRYRELFLNDDVVVTGLPSYTLPETANPFMTFAELPALSRYKFMLDDARFFVEGFIKGPVCRGQVALNVINDHFFIAFFDPDLDTISNDSRFLRDVSDYLGIPSEQESNLQLLTTWYKYAKLQKQYLTEKEKYLIKLNPDNKGNTLDFIWNGDHKNPNALLTVFRHFDSASVIYGFVGKMPKTGWVIDYPLFERIHYLLVAGFNVFGNVGHQMETRLYMDLLRMEAENSFLSFLPIESRRELWADWYTDARKGAENYLNDQFRGLERTTEVVYHTDDPKSELFNKMMQHARGATEPSDLLNRCKHDNCTDPSADLVEQRADRAMRRVAAMRGLQVQVLPDVTFVHVVTNTKSNDFAYTIIRNKALSNNSMMFMEERRRRPESDYLTVVKGYVGSYPNAFSVIPIDEIEERIDKYLKIADKLDYYNFSKKSSVQRNSDRFWAESDWHYKNYLKLQPIEAGLFDMYRFHRIAEKTGADLKW